MPETTYNKLLILIEKKGYGKELPYLEIMTTLNIRFATLKTYKDELNRSLGLKGKDKYKVVRTLNNEDYENTEAFEKLYSIKFDKHIYTFQSTLYNFYLGKAEIKQLQTDLVRIFNSVDCHQMRFSYNLDRLIRKSVSENDTYNYTFLTHLKETVESVYHFLLSPSRVKALEFLNEFLLIGNKFSYKSLQFKYTVLGYIPSAVVLEEEQVLFRTNQTRVRNSYVDYEALGTFYNSLVLFYGKPILVISKSKYDKEPRPHIVEIDSVPDFNIN